MDMLSMGGYGGYVWTSYALAVIVVLACYLQSRRRLKRIRDELTARFRATGGAAESATEMAGEKLE